ncbi:MAG: RidA family protein [Rhodobacterales bacterium]|nr:RidA family protein [Rhodobacterales bacterium]
MTASIRTKDAPSVPSLPTYAQCVEVSNASRLVFVSGQVPVREDGSVPASFEEQSRVTWENVRKQLAAADMTFDNLVKVTIFLSDRKYSADYRRTRDEALGGRRVGLTTIITGIFDEGWLLEIEAIAAA